jgi:hypothetical protein
MKKEILSLKSVCILNWWWWWWWWWWYDDDDDSNINY